MAETSSKLASSKLIGERRGGGVAAGAAVSLKKFSLGVLRPRRVALTSRLINAARRFTRFEATSRMPPHAIGSDPATLHTLLEHTKLGLERRHLLHWLGTSSRRVLGPKPLLFASPNPGLTNQIFALVGCCVLANLTSARLALPRFSSGGSAGGANATTYPFARLFDVAAFVRAMRGAVDVIEQDTSETNRTRAFALGSDRGWFVYKAVALAFPPDRDLRYSLFRHLEARVLNGLRPSAFMRKRADLVQVKLKLRSPDGYGCIHPRIERDMLKAVRFNRAGSPPPLSSYFAADWARRYSFVGATHRIFVPLSLDLRRDDERRLRRPTGWNASIVRTMGLTRSSTVWADHEAALSPPGAALLPYSSQAASTPHTLASLLDMIICRHANWFMGWSGSTYSRLLGFYQTQETRRAHAFLVACPPPVATCHAHERTSAQAQLLLSHGFCLDLHNLVTAANHTGHDQEAVRRFLHGQSVECTFV